MVINYRGRREKDLEKASKGNPSKLADRAEIGIFCLSRAREKTAENDDDAQFEVKRNEKCANCILQSELKRREISMTWANEIKINCEIIYLS